MAVIFTFSSRNADLSTEDSHRAGRIAAELAVPGFDDLAPEEQEQIILRLDHPVRKAAHMTEYAVLGVLLAGSFDEARGVSASGEAGAAGAGLFRRMLTAFSIGTLYAVTDELHQTFVPGRSGQVSDVVLDSAGVLLGILVWRWVG